jgi:hypothetical protein
MRDLAANGRGSASDPSFKKVAERLAGWVHSLGITDPAITPNYAWRHRFKTIGRQVGMDPAVMDYM